MEDIRGSTFLGEYTGELVRHEEEEEATSDGHKVTLFQISEDASIDGSRNGSKIFFINHQPFHKTNASFTYIEGPDRRKIIAFTRKNIMAGEEIFAQYSDGDHWIFPTVTATDANAYQPNQYVFVQGQDNKGKDALWIAKILKGLDNGQFEVQWAVYPADISSVNRKRYSFGENELLMTIDKADRAILQSEHLAGKATVKEHCEQSNGNELIWHKLYCTRLKQVIVGPSLVKEESEAESESAINAANDEVAAMFYDDIKIRKRKYDPKDTTVTKSTKRQKINEK
ncbi:hypothetical protein CC78DRAFT_586296 [Lojkania enalia]|uniref:SET domain-containing protein n=1 Tax=Lojkania enalia TaxID=147567 RepID=A0A9P4MZ46_9PLEO|nr:hypothetical protein CC78DRAFT_586296 [Didymosphaeria enalia]